MFLDFAKSLKLSAHYVHTTLALTGPVFLRTCLHSSDLKPEERRQATPETKASAPTETTTEGCALSKNPHELARCSPMSREEEDELSEPLTGNPQTGPVLAWSHAQTSAVQKPEVC